MSIYIFDCEVSKLDWLFIFKSLLDGTYTEIHNDNDAIRQFMEQDPLLGGFNNKHYDNHILKGILAGYDCETIKQINDLIILEGVDGWKIPELAQERIFFQSFDLMDDCQLGTSLKSFEAHLGIPIEETEVDFNLDREWTQEELTRMIRYCKYDVDATEILFHIRKGYLKNKLTLGRQCGLTDSKALYMTNAKLTSVYLQAKPPEKPWTDERNYQYPDLLLREYIPQEVFDFFDKLHDPTVSNTDLFGGYDEDGKKVKGASLEIMVGDCPCTIAYGGIHGAIPTYSETATETRTIRNKDVASYYPHLMTLPLSKGRKYGFCSRNMPSPQIYVDTLEKRVQAKKAGDKDTANALKLVLNTTYGAMLNGKDGFSYNDLYDPLMGRSVCITGQLFLLELSVHLLRECPTLKIIQLNTDGIMVSLDERDVDKWQEITQEWQDRTGFELEEDLIHKIVQKDVNNYVEVPADGGKPKVKGVQLVRGVLTNGNLDFKSMGLPLWENLSGGAFKINNDAVIVARAIQQYLIDGTTPEDTIGASDNILDFQIIAKAGGLYDSVYHVVGGREVQVQKVNRVYATDDLEMGTLFKIHGATKRPAKIGGIPYHCIVDNNNTATLDSVDRGWYIRLAWKYIRDFLGIKEPRRNTRKINKMTRTALAVLDE